MKMKKHVLAALAGTMLVPITALAQSDKPMRVAFLAASSQTGYNDATWHGVQQAAAELGNVEAEIFDGQFDAAVQFSQVEDIIASDVLMRSSWHRMTQWHRHGAGRFGQGRNPCGFGPVSGGAGSDGDGTAGAGPNGNRGAEPGARAAASIAACAAGMGTPPPALSWIGFPADGHVFQPGSVAEGVLAGVHEAVLCTSLDPISCPQPVTLGSTISTTAFPPRATAALPAGCMPRMRV